MKELLGGLAVLIAFTSYVPYIRDVAKRQTKPHAFSWLVWGTLEIIGFFGQVADHAGPGAWVTGASAVLTLTVFIFSLTRGERQITRADWLSLLGAGVAMAFWAITDSPLITVILISLIDALGFVPTFRKSFRKPREETLSSYALSFAKHAVGLNALSNYSVITMLYPLSLILTNALFVSMLFVRRRQLRLPS